MIDIDIKVPYTTKPSMVRRTKPAFVSHPSTEKITAKKLELEVYGDKLYGTTHEAVIEQLIRKSSRHCGVPETDNILDLAMCFEEDIVIMHRGRAVGLCVCFPSGWCPAEKIGLTLEEIHRPVADGQNLVAASSRLATTMADPIIGRFQRQVWTITNNHKLSNFPDSGPPWDAGSFDELYFRWENQTTEPLGDGVSSLFFISVDVVPLGQVWAELGDRILASINSMSPAILKYKNLESIKIILNNF